VVIVILVMAHFQLRQSVLRMMPTTISQALDAHGRGAMEIELQSVNQQLSDFTFNK
jgi:hypothetical protein